MLLPRFALEDWFARYKPGCAVNIGSSDIEPVTVGELGAVELRDIALGYGGALGSAELREQVATTYAGVEAEQVHCFTGATEAVFACYAALLEPGDHVVVVTPAYQLLTDLPAALGADVTRVALEVHDGEWALATAAVAAAITPRTRVIVVNSPNNPTGWVADDAQLAELAGLAGAARATLLSDEVYRGLGQATSSAIELDEASLVVGSLSKTYGTAGLRVGWTVARDPDLRDRLRTVRYWSSLSSSPVTDALAVHTLRNAETLRARATRIVDASATLLAEFVAGRDDLGVVAPRGGTTAYLELLAHDAEQVARRLAVEHLVFAVPSSALPAPGQYLRIALGRAALRDGLGALAAVLGTARDARVRGT